MNMNNQSPLLPQGSVLEQKIKGRARVKIAVFFVLAVHGIGLLALLMQGCRQEERSSQTQTTNNPVPPSLEPTTGVVADTSAPLPSTATNLVPSFETGPGLPAVGGSEYTIVSGDTLSTIARRFHLTVRAIADANPGLEPTRLQPGQKLHLPPAVSAAAASAGPASGNTGTSEQMYAVKSGDTLSTIARQYGTTVRAIRAANNLRSDSIKVGQKLKMPGKSSSPGATTPLESAAANPTPAPSR